MSNPPGVVFNKISLSQVDHGNQSYQAQSPEESVILEFFKSVDIEACLTTPKFWKYVDNLPLPLRDHIYAQIKSKVKCGKCNKRGELLACGHRICTECGSKCVCGRELTGDEQNILVKFMCYKCLRMTMSFDYSGDTCMHYCFKCIRTEVEKGKERCKICQDFYGDPELIRNYTIECQSEHKEKENLLKCSRLSCTHEFCYACTKIIKKKKVCLKSDCGKNVATGDLFRIRNQNKVICERCGNLTSIPDLVRKNCCERDCCMTCQGSSPSCVCCNSASLL